MSVPGQSAWQLIEDGLYQLILSETAAGGNPTGRLAVQPNPDGSTGIQLVENIAPPGQAVFPSIGVMCSDSADTPSASGTDDAVMNFDVIISVRATVDAAVADTRRAALAALRNYQNDASGNGIEPLIRFNSTIYDLCQWSVLRKMRRYVLVTEGDAADAIAVALYTVEAHTTLRAFA
jgi:hypothetical protein